MKQQCGETLGDLKPVYDLFTITSEITARVCDTDKWHLCKAGRFSYGESPRTPPREGTSLHRRNNSVERPWGILSLFTTCLRLKVNLLYDTGKRRVCKAGRFGFYGESLRTHPLERNSLHRRNNSVGRPWGILSLFTREFTPPEAVTQTMTSL